MVLAKRCEVRLQGESLQSECSFFSFYLKGACCPLIYNFLLSIFSYDSKVCAL